MDLDIKPAGTPLSFGAVPFPFVLVPGAGALAALRQLSASFQDKSPVIWGNEEDAARLFELYEDDHQPSAKASLAQIAGTTGAALLETYKAEVAARLVSYYEKRGQPVMELQHELPRGDWPETAAPHNVPLSLFDLNTEKPKVTVFIGLIPTSRAFEVPAHHKFGLWNDCPPPAVHTALARDWADKYGARLIINGPDVIEYEVDRPILDRDEALQMALLHGAYCEDIITQGAGTVEALAATLLGARFWYFWWD